MFDLMPIAFRNVNQLWAYILTEALKRLGLTCAIICPGSRSTPLTIAFAQQAPEIEAISILDERSAAFFALGQAQATGRPVVLVCTSGTAGANFYSAVIEASYSRVPLLVLTTDRPPELRDCHSGQTVDQLRLYGTYPNWQTELALPSADMGMLAYLRQTVIHSWERAQTPTKGPVHLNIPFRDPLAPVPDGTDLSYLQSQFHPEDFFAGIASITQFPILRLRSVQVPHTSLREAAPTTALSTSSPYFSTRGCANDCAQYKFPIPQEWKECDRGIIIAGVAQPSQPEEYCRAIAHLSQTLKWPVLAEGLSPVRNYAELNPYLISTYDLILRNQQLAKQLAPEMVIQVGEMPTSKELRSWIDATQPRRWVIDKSDQNLDPLHGRTTHLRISVEDIKVEEINLSFSSDYLQQWCDAEAKVRLAVDETMGKIDEIIESKAAWLISQILPPGTPLFIANSMPVRDVEYFWKPNNLGVRSHFNRGANGIDGTLSTALGIAHRQQSSVMLTGDLALLHDTNGFLIRNKFVGHLTIVLINNNGGGIFEMLPIAKFDPPFEEFFGTPQDIDFAQLCATYNVQHELITSWQHLQQRLNPLPNHGIRVLEVRTNRKHDAQWRKDNLGQFAVDIKI
ncbi:2-succinyl-5-enolpyruvyl-6-hydroxy-3-cyclohexene-1-carboxylic-acid synthase [Nostoc punctiforme]|uniref:2-succinyl-5-enolpyruvyl-6-hydroxy-3-cyclohexene-1-carboxylate synthase n=1 Tax=Nostoc punctiforme (strain ATCC 29133 / PCC 73102) TaxID=63737 RepID=B2J6E6_NOSP7|nr:2-succinyl-5-enolpyruvyl-6-hydroxy-3-cyclohexene-1-carboxylic-acid synthase [Nostoc punctiforme]ACC82351.1 2-succinyl-6-hydroxy-2,4-cyclohexadiene-1-carboxylic acid synthase/2-oxoglutarate decarboxylase [Nostoc punctiforme PCC 73102]